MKNILICLITSILSPSLSIAGCSSASEEPYAAAVANTKAKCAKQWTANILQIDNALFECYQKLQTTGTFTCNFTQGNIPFGKLKSLPNFLKFSNGCAISYGFMRVVWLPFILS